MQPKAIIAITWLLLSTSAPAETNARFVLPSGVKVSITESPFIMARAKVTRRGARRAGAGCLIDGRIPFGVMGDLPETYVKSITISVQGKVYLLDASQMYDAWGSRPLEYPGAIRYFGGWCADASDCQVRGVFSDGASIFVAEWRVVQGQTMRTVLTDSRDIVELFMAHIDPPRD